MSSNEKSVKEVAEDLKNAAADAGKDLKDHAQDALDSARHGAREAADAVQDAVDDVKDSAHAAAGSAKRALKKAKHRLEDEATDPNAFIDDLAARAQELAERGINFWADNSHRASRQIKTATAATNKDVTEQPGRSMLIAAATGAAVATALLLGAQKSRKKK